MQAVSFDGISQLNLENNKDFYNEEMVIDLERYAARMRKGLHIEKLFRDEMYEYFYAMGWPDIEPLKMTR